MTALILNPAAKKKKILSCFVFLSPIVPQNCTKLTPGKPTYQIFDSCTLLALLGISPLSLCSLCHYGLLSVYSRLWEAVKTVNVYTQHPLNGPTGAECVVVSGRKKETMQKQLQLHSAVDQFLCGPFFSFLSFLFFPGLKCAYSTAGFSHTAPLLDLKSPLIPATWCSLGTLWAPSAGSGRHLVVTLCACIQTGDELSRL